MPVGIYPLEKRKNLFKKGHPYLGGGWKKGHVVSEETKQKIRETNIRIGRKPPSNYGHFKEGTTGKSKYITIHAWMVREYGKPYKCENKYCHYPRYNSKGKLMKKPRRYEWSNIDHKYERNRKDWQMLCVSCHKRYDYKNL